MCHTVSLKDVDEKHPLWTTGVIFGMEPEATSPPITVTWPMWRYGPHHTSRHPWLLWSWLIAMPTSVWMIQVLWVAWVRLGGWDSDVSFLNLGNAYFWTFYEEGERTTNIYYICIYTWIFINILVHNNPWKVDVKQKKCHFSTKMRGWAWGLSFLRQKISFNFLYLLLVQFLPDIFVETCLWMKFVKQKGEQQKMERSKATSMFRWFFFGGSVVLDMELYLTSNHRNLWEGQNAALVF